MAPRKDKKQGNLLIWAKVDPKKVVAKKSAFKPSEVANMSTEESSANLSSEERVEEARNKEARLLFQEEWLDQFKWLIYNEEEVKMYCKFCLKYPHHHSAYSRTGSINFKISNLKSHSRTECHKAAMSTVLLEGKYCMKKGVKKMKEVKDEALVSLFRSAYMVAKRNLPFSTFSDIISLLQDCQVPYSTSLYNDDKACAEIVYCIAKCLMNRTLEKVATSPWFGVMVDESNDIAKHGHLIIYLSYLEDECVPKVGFYGVVRLSDGTSKTIFSAIIAELKRSKLDLSNLIAFGSDGCSTMIGKDNGLATLLKKNINPYLTSIHCVAHRSALAVANVAKNLDYCKKLDKLVNAIATYFNASSKRIEELQVMQEELACPILRLEHIFEIRWLSRHAAINKICKSLDAILSITKKDALHIYSQLSDFECVYALHFMADILGELSTLSKRFQKSYVDVTTIHSLVRNAIDSIREYYIDSRQPDCNASLYGEEGYAIIPDYGPEGGNLHVLCGALRGNMFYEEELKRNILSEDLNRAIQFQITFATMVISNLESRFEDNSILTCLKILVPAQHPIHERALKDFGSFESKQIAEFYGVQKSIEAHQFECVIDGDDFKKEFRSFKRQASIDWVRYSLPDVTSAIASNVMWRDAYPNLLTICQIALVQCCSTAMCERGFSARTVIKTKLRNRLEVKSLNGLMKIAIEGPSKLTESKLIESMELWAAQAHRILYTGQGIYSLILQ